MSKETKQMNTDRAPATGGVPSDLLRDMAKGIDPSAPVNYFDIERLLDLDIQGWKPKPGDKLVGQVVNIETGGQGSTFGPYPLLTIRSDATGEFVNLHAFHTVLRTELGRKQVGIGDRIGVKYLGGEDMPDGMSYENYKVVTQPSGAARLALPDQIK